MNPGLLLISRKPESWRKKLRSPRDTTLADQFCQPSDFNISDNNTLDLYSARIHSTEWSTYAIHNRAVPCGGKGQLVAPPPPEISKPI